MKREFDWDQGLFGDRLQAEIKKKFKTQERFCRHAGIGPSRLSQWKTSPDNKPSVADIAYICEVLQESPGWLAFGEDIPRTDAEYQAMRLMRRVEAHASQKVPAVLTTLEAMAGLVEIKEFTPGAAVEEHASEPSISQPLHLEPAEFQSVMKWLVDEAAKIQAERPLHTAIQKIATRLIDDNAPASRPERSDKARSARGSGGKDVPNVRAPLQPTARHKTPGSKSSS